MNILSGWDQALAEATVGLPPSPAGVRLRTASSFGEAERDIRFCFHEFREVSNLVERCDETPARDPEQLPVEVASNAA